MPTLNIPERFKPGFVALADLPEPSFRELLRAVEAAPDTLTSTRELQRKIASDAKSVPSGESAKIIDSIASVLRFVSGSHGWSIPKVVEALKEAASTGIENFRVPEGVDFGARLESLLRAESFRSVSMKAKNLQSEAERTFCDARILTDIRPIFGDEVGGQPAALMVVHNLKIVTHEGSGHKEFYVALDTDDIKSLQTILSRAQEKAQSLKSLIDASGLRSIDPSSKE